MENAFFEHLKQMFFSSQEKKSKMTSIKLQMKKE